MLFTYLIISFYIIINIVSFIMMLFDKKQSQSRKTTKIRVREKTLLLIALFGGMIGSITSMYWFRHKTKHNSFIIVFWFSLLLHIVLWAYIFNLKH